MTLYACRLGSEKNFHITKYLYNTIKFSIKKVPTVLMLKSDNSVNHVMSS